MDTIEDKIKTALPGLEVVGDDFEGAKTVTVILEDENENGDNFVALVGRRADNTAYVSFYEDYYEPDNCTEFFECKDIDHAVKILASCFSED